MINKTTSPFLRVDRAPSRLARFTVGLSGALFVLVALLLLFAPRWFFDYVGNFPPFNRHYEGDLGAFLLPLGAGLLYATQNPAKYRGLIAVAGVGSAIHFLNHVADDVFGTLSIEHMLVDTIPLLIVLGVLIVAWREAK